MKHCPAQVNRTPPAPEQEVRHFKRVNAEKKWSGHKSRITATLAQCLRVWQQRRSAVYQAVSGGREKRNTDLIKWNDKHLPLHDTGCGPILCFHSLVTRAVRSLSSASPDTKHIAHQEPRRFSVNFSLATRGRTENKLHLRSIDILARFTACPKRPLFFSSLAKCRSSHGAKYTSIFLRPYSPDCYSAVLSDESLSQY